ncbi:DUF202 domain-containing protein [Pseudarthrobacter niigatensis]|nr:DUF202 domain-containing protein [Pseudarthrobacter niigatensis]
MRQKRQLPVHSDVGLQPERTDLAWRRTTMSLIAAAAVFLRWIPHHGWFVGTLVLSAIATAFAISLTHTRRFRRAVHGINHDSMRSDALSPAAIAAAVAVLATLGIYTVLFLPLEH